MVAQPWFNEIEYDVTDKSGFNQLQPLIWDIVALKDDSEPDQ